MNCSKCGTASPGGSPYCSTCGGSLLVGGVMPPIPAMPEAERTSGMAIAGFVLAFVCGLLGLIFSAMGYSECKKSGGKIKGQGLALAGLIISIVSMAIAILGILAAVAIPSFLDYSKVAKRTEAKVQLMKIRMSAMSSFNMNSEFPRGTTQLTPAVPCCAQNAQGRHKCQGHQRGDWDNPVWQALDFQMDEDFLYQYSYTSDGRSFTATAVGDLDCDSEPGTYELRGTIVNGSPEIIMTEPPPGVQ